MTIGQQRVYTLAEITQEFMQLPLPQQCSMLFNALDVMQAYQGRSQFICIALAMGYHIIASSDDGEAPQFYRGSPKVESIEEEKE